MHDEPLVCGRCCCLLTPGRGELFEVRIEAVADPHPPDLSLQDLLRDHRREMAELVEQASELSERELLDQVYRRVTLQLCNRCFREWIEDPAGRRDDS